MKPIRRFAFWIAVLLVCGSLFGQAVLAQIGIGGPPPDFTPVKPQGQQFLDVVDPPTSDQPEVINFFNSARGFGGKSSKSPIEAIASVAKTSERRVLDSTLYGEGDNRAKRKPGPLPIFCPLPWQITRRGDIGMIAWNPITIAMCYGLNYKEREKLFEPKAYQHKTNCGAKYHREQWKKKCHPKLNGAQIPGISGPRSLIGGAVADVTGAQIGGGLGGGGLGGLAGGPGGQLGQQLDIGATTAGLAQFVAGEMWRKKDKPCKDGDKCKDKGKVSCFDCIDKQCKCSCTQQQIRQQCQPVDLAGQVAFGAGVSAVQKFNECDEKLKEEQNAFVRGESPPFTAHRVTCIEANNCVLLAEDRLVVAQQILEVHGNKARQMNGQLLHCVDPLVKNIAAIDSKNELGIGGDGVAGRDDVNDVLDVRIQEQVDPDLRQEELEFSRRIDSPLSTFTTSPGILSSAAVAKIVGAAVEDGVFPRLPRRDYHMILDRLRRDTIKGQVLSAIKTILVRGVSVGRNPFLEIEDDLMSVKELDTGSKQFFNNVYKTDDLYFARYKDHRLYIFNEPQDVVYGLRGSDNDGITNRGKYFELSAGGHTRTYVGEEHGAISEAGDFNYYFWLEPGIHDWDASQRMYTTTTGVLNPETLSWVRVHRQPEARLLDTVSVSYLTGAVTAGNSVSFQSGGKNIVDGLVKGFSDMYLMGRIGDVLSFFPLHGYQRLKGSSHIIDYKNIELFHLYRLKDPDGYLYWLLRDRPRERTLVMIPETGKIIEESGALPPPSKRASFMLYEAGVQ